MAGYIRYVNSLRSMSHGRANFTKQFDHFAPASLPEDDRPAIGDPWLE
jgi:translation elongation factor EF-G